jgi:hypothetical protein
LYKKFLGKKSNRQGGSRAANVPSAPLCDRALDGGSDDPSAVKTDSIFLSSSPYTICFCERNWSRSSRTFPRSGMIFCTLLWTFSLQDASLSSGDRCTCSSAALRCSLILSSIPYVVNHYCLTSCLRSTPYRVVIFSQDEQGLNPVVKKMTRLCTKALQNNCWFCDRHERLYAVS